MGNADLRELCHIEEIDYEELSEDVVAVDAPNWIHKYLATTTKFTDTDSYTTSDGVEVPNLIGCLRGIQKFYDNNIIPIFVFDGEAHPLKSQEIERRKEKIEEAKSKREDAEDAIEASKFESRSQRMTTEIKNTTQELFDRLDIAYFTAPSAGESQAAHMVQETEEITAMVSDDYDSILFGSPHTIRNFTSSQRQLEDLQLEKTLANLDIDRTTLIRIAILCGTDYNDGVYGIASGTAPDKVENFKEVIQDSDESIDEIETIERLFMNPNVTDEYPVPSDKGVPDTEAVRELLQEWEVDMSEVSSALETVEEVESERKQTDLSSWE